MRLSAPFNHQFKVLAAVGDGAAAVQAVEEYDPDIVLLDISVPVLNGFQAAEQISRAKPAVKIIMVTSYASPAYVKEAFRRGVKGYVAKGRINDLFQAIHAVMQRQSYRPQIGR